MKKEINNFINFNYLVYDASKGAESDLRLVKVISIFKRSKLLEIDSYFAINQLGKERILSAIDVIEFSKRVIQNTYNFNNEITKIDLQIRIGINSGSVTTGVIGKNKFAFDLWGSTINKASRLESTCPTGKIQISEETKILIGKRYNTKIRKNMLVKGIGKINTYLLD